MEQRKLAVVGNILAGRKLEAGHILDLRKLAARILSRMLVGRILRNNLECLSSMVVSYSFY